MEWITHLIDFILHIDRHLAGMVGEYREWTYLILFLIVFCETGLVVTPFLPGDSLLFAAGAVAAMPDTGMNIAVLMGVLILAAFLGDNANYFAGKLLGTTVYERNYRFINRQYLERTRLFYEKHGGKTVIIARYIPIIRTFAPFVAGVGAMRYRRFILFSLAGTLSWVCVFCLAGYFFGNIPAVKRNFTLVIFAIILLSVTPPFVAYLRHKTGKR